MRVFCAVLILLVAITSFAAEVHLGPSIPLDQTLRRDGPPSVQSGMHIVWRGDKGLAAWIDQRGQYPPDTYVSLVRPSSVVYVSPMRADGSLELPAGKRLMDGAAVSLASADDSHIMATVYQTIDHTFMLPIDLQGNRLQDPRPVVMGGVFSDGKTFMTPGGYIYALDGTPIVRGIFDVHNSIAALPGLYLGVQVIWNGNLVLQTMQDDGTVKETAVAKVNPYSSVAIGIGDNAALMVVTSTDAIDSYLVDLQGKLLRATPVYRGPLRLVERPVWDGTTFLVTWDVPTDSTIPFYQPSTRQAKRVSAAGELLDVFPLTGTTIAARVTSSFTTVKTPAGIVMRWTEYPPGKASDIVGTVVTSNSDVIASAPLAVSPAVASAAAQTQIRFAPNSARPIAVWQESSRTSRIMMSIGDQTFDVASSTDAVLKNPVVVRNSDQILVVWRSTQPSVYRNDTITGGEILARRFSLDGTALGTSALKLGNITDYDPVDLQAAFDGASFIVSWASYDSVHLSRITPAGEMLQPITVAPNSCCNTAPYLIPSDRGTLVLWSQRDTSTSWMHVFSTNIDTHAAAPATGNITTTAFIGPNMRLPVFASNDHGDTLIAWSDAKNCVAGMLIDKNGAVILGPKPISCEGKQEQVAVAWSGSEFVVAWSKLDPVGGIRGMRVDSVLHLLDDTAFDLAPGAYEPSLVQNGSGVTIGYVATGIDEVPRAFIRTLQKLGASTRGRAAGH